MMVSPKSYNQILNSKVDRLATHFGELNNRMVTANASGFYSPSGNNKSIRIRETYPISWSNISTTSAPKAIPLTLSSWYTRATDFTGGNVNRVIANLGGVPTWLLTQASLYNEYRFVSDPILHWVPAGGTAQVGQISFGQLRDPNDLFRGNSTLAATSYIPLRNSSGVAITPSDVLTMEHSYAGPVSLPFSHRFPLNKERRMSTWMRQDGTLIANQISGSAGGVYQSIPTANTRLDAPFGVICVQSDQDIFTSSTLGRLFIEYDLEFRSRVIPGLQTGQDSPTVTLTNNKPLTVIPIDPSDLIRGKVYLGVQKDESKELKYRAFRKSTSPVDPISKVKLLASNQLLITFDLGRIQDKSPNIRIQTSTEVRIIPQNASLSLPSQNTYDTFSEWNFDFVPIGDNHGIIIESNNVDHDWSGNLSWTVLD